MSRSNIPDPDELRGQLVEDADGHPIGTILGVYLDNQTREPEWVAVRLPSTMIALIPVSEATVGPRGLQVRFSLAQVLDAPYRQSQLAQAISEHDKDTLYRHYADAAGELPPQPPPRPAAVTDQASTTSHMAVAGAKHVGATALAGGQEVAASAVGQAGEVASSAKDQASAVAGTAMHEASQVAGVASAEAHNMLEATTDEVVGQAQAQLEVLAEAMHRWAGQALALARGNPDMAGPVGEAVERGGAELQSASRRIQARGSKGLLDDAQKVVREHPRAATIATALAFIGGGKLFASPAGDRVKAMIAPLKEQATEAGRSLVKGLTPVVERRVENVKATATQAADELKQHVQSSAQHVKGRAKASAATVEGTARASAATVKRTAAASTSAVKRSTRSVPSDASPALAG